LIKELEGHTSKVVSLTESGDLVWSASFDKSILLWDKMVFFPFLNHLEYSAN
jgi:hypothetical protein